MAKFVHSVRRLSVVFWLIFTTIFIEALCSTPWWHPKCNVTLFDGDVAYLAYGFPLPFLQLDGTSSMAFVYMPHVLLINLGIVAAVAIAAIRFILHQVQRWSNTAATWLAFSGLILCMISAYPPIVIFWQEGTARITIADPWNPHPQESYFSYRPLAIVEKDRIKNCQY